MPRYPSLSAPAESLPLSIYARLVALASQVTGPVFPFHIGETHLGPPESARLGALGFSGDADPALYRYSSPSGDAQLIAAIVAKLVQKNGMEVSDENVQITNGATHALSCATRAVLDPGDAVLLLAPYWPLMRGIVLSLAARPIEVPFSRTDMRGPGTDIGRLLEEHVPGRTAAIYVTTPNNPDGKVLTRAELEVIADVARRHDLWVLSDEAYEEYTFDGREHVSIATLPGMAERTLTAFSFSKTFAMPGVRVGYVVGPAGTIEAARKMANHSVYSVARALQRAAAAALQSGPSFIAEMRAAAEAARDRALARIQAPCARPEGSSYLFLDFSGWLDTGQDSAQPVLERMASAGVLLAPGGAFGQDYRAWARLCYTSVPLDRLDQGIDRMNRLLDESRR
jgi:aspartate/methionine/tyrosine aminotransferase